MSSAPAPPPPPAPPAVTSSATLPPLHGTSQTYVSGYSDYKIKLRFNLNFPVGTNLGADGLPQNCILVFGPNAFPAISGPGGEFIDTFRMQWPDFNINYIRLSKRDETITGGLQMVFWISRRLRNCPAGIEITQANLLHGMRRWAQFRLVKNPDQFPDPQLMFIDEFYRHYPQQFVAPRSQTAASAPPTASRIFASDPAYRVSHASRASTVASGPNTIPTLPLGDVLRIRSAPTAAIHTSQVPTTRSRVVRTPRKIKEEIYDSSSFTSSSPPRRSRRSSSRKVPREHRYSEEEVRGSSRIHYRSPTESSSRVRRHQSPVRERISTHGRSKQDMTRSRSYRERSPSPEARPRRAPSPELRTRRRSRSPSRSGDVDISRQRAYSVYRVERKKHRSRSPRPY